MTNCTSDVGYFVILTKGKLTTADNGYSRIYSTSNYRVPKYNKNEVYSLESDFKQPALTILVHYQNRSLINMLLCKKGTTQPRSILL